MQEADRAAETARQAGKDKICPVEFKAAEEAKNKAYDVFRACNTEEGAALAKQATAKANALCPPQTAGKEEAQPAEALLEPVPAAEPTPEMMKYCVSLDIEFDINKADIRPQYHDEVAKVGDFMKKHPTTTAVIEGYADEVGSDEYNLQLSHQTLGHNFVHIARQIGHSLNPLQLVLHQDATGLIKMPPGGQRTQ